MEVVGTRNNLQTQMVAPQTKGKDHGKRCSELKSSRCFLVSALSCCAYKGEGNISPGGVGEQRPLLTLPLSHGNLDC